MFIAWLARRVLNSSRGCYEIHNPRKFGNLVTNISRKSVRGVGYPMTVGTTTFSLP